MKNFYERYKNSGVLYYLAFVLFAVFLYEIEASKYSSILKIPISEVFIQILIFALILWFLKIVLFALFNQIGKNEPKTLEEKITIVFLTGVLLIFSFLYFPELIKNRILIERMTQIYNKIDNLENVADDSVLYEIQEMSDISDFFDINDYEHEKRLY